MNLLGMLAIFFLICAILTSLFAMISSKRLNTLYKDEIHLAKMSSNADVLLTQKLNTSLETANQENDKLKKALEKLKAKTALTEKKLANIQKKLKEAQAKIEAIKTPAPENQGVLIQQPDPQSNTLENTRSLPMETIESVPDNNPSGKTAPLETNKDASSPTPAVDPKSEN